jgi:hypothetical protein
MTIRKSRSTFFETTEQLAKSRRQATALNQLLKKITTSLRRRGLPVVICVNSFSMFAPHRISEAHVQILHAPLVPQHQPDLTMPDERSAKRSCFIEPFHIATAESRSVSRFRPRFDSSVFDMTAPTSNPKYRHLTSQNRDHSQPWPLRPNAIPSRKRQLMNENADRYGVDPYFRAWL